MKIQFRQTKDIYPSEFEIKFASGMHKFSFYEFGYCCCSYGALYSSKYHQRLFLFISKDKVIDRGCSPGSPRAYVCEQYGLNPENCLFVRKGEFTLASPIQKT